jgi:hypothetical protein
LGRYEELGSIRFFPDKHKKLCINAQFFVHCLCKNGSIFDGLFQIRQGIGLIAKDHSAIPTVSRHIFLNAVIPFDQFGESKLAQLTIGFWHVDVNA